jgi:hypothetical protein
VSIIDLHVIQIDQSELQTHGPRIQRQIESIIDDVGTRSGGLPVLVGTVESFIYKQFLKSRILVKFFPNESSFEESAKLYVEAQEFAQQLVAKVGESHLFKGINLFDTILFDLTALFHTILRINGLVQSKAEEPGILILLTGLKPFPRESVLPIKELIRIRSRKEKIRKIIMYAFRAFLGVCRGAGRAFAGKTAVRPIDAQVPPPGTGRKRILFVAIETGRVDVSAEPLSFILGELKKHSDLVSLVAVDNSFTQRYLEERGFGSLRFAKFESWEGHVHWLRSRAIFTKAALQMIKQFSTTTVHWLMLSVFINRYLTLRSPSEIYARIVWLSGVFDGFLPDAVVILPVYPHVGMIAARLARIRGIPTLTSVLTWPYGVRPSPGNALYASGFVDVTNFVALPGEDSKRAFVASGLNPDKLILVGNPKFDAIVNARITEDKSIVYKLFGGNPTGHIFLVVTYLFAPGSREWVHALVRQLKNLEPHTFKLVIKPHPDEGPEGYEQILREEGLAEAIVSKGISLYTLLDACDIVFTTVSTAGSEAILFNKPLISINLSGNDFAVRYDEEGVALLVKREEDVLPAIDAVLNDDKVKREFATARKRFQERYAYKLDGKSSERFVEAISHMANHEPNQYADSHSW